MHSPLVLLFANAFTYICKYKTTRTVQDTVMGARPRFFCMRENAFSNKFMEVLQLQKLSMYMTLCCINLMCICDVPVCLYISAELQSGTSTST